jgi:putative membrane protein
MRFLAKIVIAIIVNGAALLAAAYWLPGFTLKNDFLSVAWIALALTALNYTLKPVLKLFLGPIIVLTLGLGLILVNAIILYILDIFSPDLTIQGVLTLIYAALVIGAVNFFFHLATKTN